jgi:hypothetical protein
MRSADDEGGISKSLQNVFGRGRHRLRQSDECQILCGMIGGAGGPLPQNLCRRHGARTCSIRRVRAHFTARVNERVFRREQPLGGVPSPTLVHALLRADPPRHPTIAVSIGSRWYPRTDFRQLPIPSQRPPRRSLALAGRMFVDGLCDDHREAQTNGDASENCDNHQHDVTSRARAQKARSCPFDSGAVGGK